MHDLLRSLISLRFHVNILVFLQIHLNSQNSKGRPTKIQGNEISLFCLERQQVSHQIQVLQEGPTFCSLSAGSSHLPPPTTQHLQPENRSHANLIQPLPCLEHPDTCSQPSILRQTALSSLALTSDNREMKVLT